MSIYSNSPEAFLYIWINIETGKTYIGMHRGHPEDGYICSSKYMMEDYKKNPTNFHRSILRYGSRDEMLELEKQYLEKVNAAQNPLYYNRNNGSGTWYISYHTEETKQKLRNRIVSEETRKKMSDAQKGKPKSLEHRKKLSEINIGKVPWNKERKSVQVPWNKGKSHKWWKHTEETKRKMSEKMKGKIGTNIGKKFSLETKKRMSEAAKELWKRRKQKSISVDSQTNSLLGEILLVSIQMVQHR